MTDWRRIRDDILQRGGRKCVACGAEATLVAHRTPRKFGGTDNLANLVPVCEKHLTKRV